MAFTDKSAPAVTLIVAGIGAALGQSVAGSLHGQQVALLAGRGELRHSWNRRDQVADLYAWQRGLLATLGLEELTYRSAAVSALGASDLIADVEGFYWMHAEPVHLVAGLDRLTLQPLTDAAAITDTERQLLQPLIREHLRESRWQLQANSEQWLLRAEKPMRVITASPETAAVNALEEVMPRGSDAGELRRAMTEWQMVLHEHPVSERRARRGLPAINALWPWGGGVLPTVVRRALPSACANDAFTRGVYRLHGADVLPLPENAAKFLEHARTSAHTLAVLELHDLATLERDWLVPLEQALRNNAIRQLDTIFDEWHIRLTRGMLRRFWRKPLQPADWP